MDGENSPVARRLSVEDECALAAHSGEEFDVVHEADLTATELRDMLSDTPISRSGATLVPSTSKPAPTTTSTEEVSWDFV